MKSKIIKIIGFLALSFSLMGNKGCKEQQVQERELRRRVQLGAIQAPNMPLPNNQQFDFKYAANAQMYTVLKKNAAFSTATVDNNNPLDPSQMSPIDQDTFYSCYDQHAFTTNQFSQVAACMVRLPQAKIRGDIINFQLVTSTGVTVGIPDWGNLSAGVGFKKAILTMTMRADDPYIDNHTIAATTQKSKATEVKFNGSVGFGMIGLGWEYYQSSDLASVVEKAMNNSINDLKEQWNEAEDWYGMVLKACDTAIMINAGGATDVGLKVGDLLEVYNVYYDWEGEICESQLLGTMQATPKGKPIAVVQVDIVGDTMSRATVIEQTGESIRPGARVYVRKLVQ